MDLFLIDEAAQLKECESLIPLQLRGLKHAVLIGDECQLPATVKSKVSICSAPKIWRLSPSSFDCRHMVLVMCPC
jgi:superfamily I DNA and/or RNA helicase